MKKYFFTFFCITFLFSQKIFASSEEVHSLGYQYLYFGYREYYSSPGEFDFPDFSAGLSMINDSASSRFPFKSEDLSSREFNVGLKMVIDDAFLSVEGSLLPFFKEKWIESKTNRTEDGKFWVYSDVLRIEPGFFLYSCPYIYAGIALDIDLIYAALHHSKEDIYFKKKPEYVGGNILGLGAAFYLFVPNIMDNLNVILHCSVQSMMIRYAEFTYRGYWTRSYAVIPEADIIYKFNGAMIFFNYLYARRSFREKEKDNFLLYSQEFQIGAGVNIL